MSLNVVRLSRAFGTAVLAASLAACDISVDRSGSFTFEVAAGKAEDEWTRRYDLAPDSRFALINVNGQITAEVSEGTAVEVVAERIARALDDASARELLGQIDIHEEVGDTSVGIEVRAPRTAGMTGHEVRWTVRVPKGVHVDLQTVNGGVRLDGLNGDIRARSTNGGVTGQALRPTSLEAGVTNGGVKIELAVAPESGTFALESVNGGVELSLPGDSKADVTARCVNGGINVSGLDLQLSGEQSRRRLDGQLNGGGARVSLSTTNGGVKLTKAP